MFNPLQIFKARNIYKQVAECYLFVYATTCFMNVQSSANIQSSQHIQTRAVTHHTYNLKEGKYYIDLIQSSQLQPRGFQARIAQHCVGALVGFM